MFTKPRRKLTAATTAGYDAIAFATDVLCMTLLPWQRWLLLHMLELNPDGTFRFRTVVILVARQNGKTRLMQVVSLWRMYVDGVALVIGTAQNLDIAEEAWEATVELASSVPDLAAEIKHVDRTNGKKALRLHTGERYKVAASSRRGGRGLSGDLAVLDELREHRNWQSWSAVSKTTMARAHAQVIGMSNAGDSESVVLSHLRDRALAAIAANNRNVSLGLFEWSAPEDAELDDRSVWPMANPSLGHPGMITEEAIANALETDPEDEFKTEVLCQWSDKVTTPTIPPDDWDERADQDSEIVGPVYIAVDIDTRRKHASIAAGGASSIAGRTHVELVQTDITAVDGLFAELVDLHSKYRCSIVLDPNGPAGSLIPKLIKASVPVIEVSGGRVFAQACADFHDGVITGELVHIGQEQLDDSIVDTQIRRLGESWAFTHRGADEDATPLIAAVLAYWAASTEAESDYDVLASVLAPDGEDLSDLDDWPDDDEDPDL